MTKVIGNSTNGYTRQSLWRPCHLQLPKSPDAEMRHFYYRWVCRFLLLCFFRTEFPLSLSTFSLLLPSTFAFQYVSWISASHTRQPHFPPSSCTMSCNYPRLALKALCNLISFFHYSCICLFIFSLNSYLLSNYYVQGIMVGIGDAWLRYVICIQELRV